MPVADRIHKLGFRRWHERQLIEAHASLVTAFLCVIVIAACLDQLHWRDAGFKPLIMLALIVAGIVLCFKTVTIYFKVLFRAEHYAQQAVCGECKIYGALDVRRYAAESTVAGHDWFNVRCKKCGHSWTIADESEGQPPNKPV
jgi:hypothetical protein